MTMLRQTLCLFIFLVILAAFSVKELEAKNENEYPSPRIVLLTYEGVDKESLGNVLLNRPFNSKHESDQKCFHYDEKTKEICIESGEFLGQSDKKVTLVDTPAFKKQMTQTEFQKMEEYVKGLKNDLGYVNVFLIVFNGGTQRYKGEIDNMIQQIDGMFVDEVWNHVMLEVTNWAFNARDNKTRHEQNTPRTEEKWMTDRIKTLRGLYTIPANALLDTTFIDSDYNDTAANEKQKFLEYTDKLWTFANDVGQFECNDINAVWDDLSIIKNENKNLEDTIKEKEENVTILKEQIRILTNKISTNGLETQYVVIIAFVCFAIGFLAYRIVHTNCIGQNNHTECAQEDDLEAVISLEEQQLVPTEDADEGSNTNNANDTSNMVVLLPTENTHEEPNTNKVNDTSND